MTRTMKDSGVEWIGQIPKQWNLTRIAGLYNLRNTKVSDKDFPALSVTNKGILPQLETAAKTNAGDNRKLVCIGDFAINSRSDRRGSCGISPYNGSVSLINLVLTPLNKTIPKYFDLLFHTIQFGDEFYRWGYGIVDDLWSTGWDEMKKILVPLPPLPEQQAIADYLDDKCAQIDNITGTINEQIEVLKQYKKSVITEAVTKGLDPNAPMKDSGVEWIGRIPEKWKVKKTLYCLQMPLTDGPHETPTLYDEGIPFISAEAIANESIDFSKKRGYISEEYYKLCCKKYKPELLDIYMVKSGATTGKTAIVETTEIFTIWSPLAVFRANKDIIMPYYLYYFIKSNAYLTQIETNWTYGTQQNIGMRSLERLKICVPPIFEQKAIVNYLDDKCSQIDAVIADKQAQLETLAAYKKSLIYEYVTGKKSVHGFEEA